jgi:hypothetical protein
LYLPVQKRAIVEKSVTYGRTYGSHWRGENKRTYGSQTPVVLFRVDCGQYAPKGQAAFAVEYSNKCMCYQQSSKYHMCTGFNRE